MTISPMNHLVADAHVVLLILFSCLCGAIAVLFALQADGWLEREIWRENPRRQPG
jgi:hypothetical protein